MTYNFLYFIIPHDLALVLNGYIKAFFTFKNDKENENKIKSLIYTVGEIYLH